MECTLEDLIGYRRFTPYGILQNVKHIYPRNPSGVVRSLDTLKFGWLVNFDWFITKENAVYVASLGLGFRIGDTLLYGQESFKESGVEVWSDYHTKNCIRQKWVYDGIDVSCTYVLVNGDVLSCKVEVANLSRERKTVDVFGVSELEYGGKDLEGSREENRVVIGVRDRDDYGNRLSLILSSDRIPVKTSLAAERSSVLNILRGLGGGESSQRVSARGFLSGILSFRLVLKPGERSSLTLTLFRCLNSCAECLEKMRSFTRSFDEILSEKVREDREFWRRSALLVGDWPTDWLNGFIYDIETLRLVIYPPAGVFRHKWDAMHVNWPRNVVAEASMDMLIMCHVNPEIAKEVIYGLYADALAPNVPCVHADGTYNMVAYDGSRCGTSPAWCLPFYCYSIMFSLTWDRDWLKSLYPYWREFLIWWIKNRSDDEGYLHYKCSWESGEDCARRFGIKDCAGNESTEHIRAAELQAVMSHAARTMRYYCEIIGEEEDAALWRKVEEEYFNKLKSMWFKDWFHDFDRERNEYTPYTDPLHLAPIFMDMVELEEAIKLTSNPGELITKLSESVGVNALDWPPMVFPLLESLNLTGEYESSIREYMVDTLFNLLTLVYEAENSYLMREGRPLPGVSYEKWEWPELRFAGVEGYGWGAFTALAVIRYVLGFQVFLQPEKAFYLYPGFHEKLMVVGNRYGIKRLRFRDVELDLEYKVKGNDRLELTANILSRYHQNMLVADADGNVLKEFRLQKGRNMVSLTLKNNRKYTFKIS